MFVRSLASVFAIASVFASTAVSAAPEHWRSAEKDQTFASEFKPEVSERMKYSPFANSEDWQFLIQAYKLINEKLLQNPEQMYIRAASTCDDLTSDISRKEIAKKHAQFFRESDPNLHPMILKLAGNKMTGWAARSYCDELPF